MEAPILHDKSSQRNLLHLSFASFTLDYTVALAGSKACEYNQGVNSQRY